MRGRGARERTEKTPERTRTLTQRNQLKLETRPPKPERVHLVDVEEDLPIVLARGKGAVAPLSPCRSPPTVLGYPLPPSKWHGMRGAVLSRRSRQRNAFLSLLNGNESGAHSDERKRSLRLLYCSNIQPSYKKKWSVGHKDRLQKNCRGEGYPRKQKTNYNRVHILTEYISYTSVWHALR